MATSRGTVRRGAEPVSKAWSLDGKVLIYSAGLEGKRSLLMLSPAPNKNNAAHHSRRFWQPLIRRMMDRIHVERLGPKRSIRRRNIRAAFSTDRRQISTISGRWL